MKKVKGDLLQLFAEDQFDVIIHGCNCMCVMGAGIAKTIKTIYPEAYKADLSTTKGDRSKLGTISFAEVKVEGKLLIIVNAYTQYHWRGRGVKADYDAIRNAFKMIQCEFSGKRIAYPAIGAGLAGGNWELISGIINEELKGEDHTFVEYAPA